MERKNQCSHYQDSPGDEAHPMEYVSFTQHVGFLGKIYIIPPVFSFFCIFFNEQFASVYSSQVTTNGRIFFNYFRWKPT